MSDPGALQGQAAEPSETAFEVARDVYNERRPPGPSAWDVRQNVESGWLFSSHALDAALRVAYRADQVIPRPSTEAEVEVLVRRCAEAIARARRSGGGHPTQSDREDARAVLRTLFGPLPGDER